MFKDLKNQFMQITCTTLILVMILVTLEFGDKVVDIEFFWRMFGISIITAIILGVIYPYCWNYSTWKAYTNIIITTLINSIGGYGVVYLFSKEMFQHIIPYWWGVLLITLVLHMIVFYFYRKVRNRKLIDELNKSI